MIHLLYSNRLEALADALADDLAAGPRDPLGSSCVVVPSRQLAAYAENAIARRTGIAANLQFPFLERFLADRLPAGRGVRALDRGRLHALLLGLLAQPELLARAELATVREYLEAADGGDADRAEDARELRRFQLAGHVAALFHDYTLARPEIADGWRRGAAPHAPEGAALEAWQRRLWQGLFGARGVLEKVRAATGVRWLPLPAAYDDTPAGELVAPARVHVFGFSYLPRAVLRMFEQLGRVTELRIHALNPCREFWEDVVADGVPPGEAALARWGRAGRDHVRMLTDLTGGNFAERFVEPAGDSLLGTLQADVLGRTGSPPPAGPAHVRVLACPGMQREVEVIAGEIWRLIEADPTLRCNDIAVLVPQPEYDLYQPRLAAVCQELYALPLCAVDVPLGAGGRLVEAVELLLALPFGRFTRPELLRLLTHPAVLARHPGGDPEAWRRWTDALGIVHGADRADHLDTYLAAGDLDVLTWDQGLRRLALGAFMAGAPSGDERAFSHGGRSYLPEEVAPDALGGAARLAALARDLIDDARDLRAARMPLTQWRLRLDAVLSTYLAASSDDEARDLARCRDAVAGLAELDLDGRPTGYRTACELVRAALGALRSDRGEYLSEGIMVAPLAPMRPVPFRVIFVAGLGEGKFPAAERPQPLDLRRNMAAHAGDVGARDRDRYLFLEALLAARERIYLSYVARDEQSGDPREPAAVVQELRELLEAGYLGLGASEALVERHPLRRHAPAYFPALFEAAGPAVFAAAGLAAAPLATVAAPAARGEAQARALRSALTAAGAPAGRWTVDDLRARVTTASWPRVHERLGLVAPPARAGQPGALPTLTVSLANLRQFLECPMQASARLVLGLREDEDDTSVTEDEVFETTALVRAELLRAVLLEHLGGGAEAGDVAALAKLYDRRAARLELAGRVPSGRFGEWSRERDLGLLERWRRHLATLCPGPLPRFAALCLGRAEEHAAVDEILPPLALTVELPDARVQVELVGRTQPLAEGQSSLVLVTAYQATPKYLLRGFLDHVVLAALGRSEGSHRSLVAPRGRKPLDEQLAPWTRDEALAYLRGLCADLLGGVHDYLMPCEAVFRQASAKPARTLDDAVADLLVDPVPRHSSYFGPVRHLDGFSAPPDGDALIARRFGPYFARRGAGAADD